MSVIIIDKKVSTGRKRIDAIVKKTALFRNDRFLKIRILAYDPLTENEDEIEELFETVIANEKRWKDCKKSCTFSLTEENATAFILDKNYKIEEDEDS